MLKAAPDGDSWSISGTKLFVPYAHVSDYMLCVARTAEGKMAEEGITVFIVDSKAQGVGCTVLDSIAGKLCEVTFDKVKVSKENIVGTLNEGWKLVKSTIDRADVANCCEMIGLAQQALDMTVDYAKERKQFGQFIYHFQSIKNILADMEMNINAAKLLLEKAASMKDAGKNITKEASEAKLFASDMVMKITRDALQIFGGYGYSREFPLERFYRDAKITEIGDGTSEMQRMVIAGEICKRNPSQLPPPEAMA